MDIICDKEQCFGCCACYNSCPVDAISMVEDDWGNIVPSINQQKCIDCGKCKKVCPAINDSDFKKPMNTYAAIAKDEYIYTTATSGGIATVMSEYVIENNGVVYGAAFKENSLELTHTRVNKIDDLEKLKGSKYVQSNVGFSYQQVKKDLIDGLLVIFIGTPCQTDGLIKYLGKDYGNLITVNLICHGIPANRLLTEHVKSILNTDNLDEFSLSFRGDNGFKLCLSQNKKKVYESPFNEDSYFLGFMRKLFYRQCCYSCKYAQKNRVGDFTIGDFWGFNQSKPFVIEPKNGLSVILVNTEKGNLFFDKISDKMIYQKRDLEEAVNGNPQLKYPSKKNRSFEKFRKLYLKHGFEKAANKTLSIYKIAYKIIFAFHK